MKTLHMAGNILLATCGVAIVLFSFSFISIAEAADDTNACVAPTISGFVPYIYDGGQLHSFDYLVNQDRDVVQPLQTRVSVDNVDLRFVSEWTHVNGTRVHVDVPNWDQLSGDIPVVITVRSGSDTSCETENTFTVNLPDRPITPPVTSSGSTSFGTGGPITTSENTSADTTSQPQTSPATTQTHTETAIDTSSSMEHEDTTMVMEDTSDKGGESEDSTTELEDVLAIATSSTDTATSSEDADRSSLLASIGNLFGGSESTTTPSNNLCTSLPTSAWAALALLHIVIAGATLFFLRERLAESNLWFAVALLVPFVLFLVIWFVFDGCRSSQWFPVVVALVSLGTVLAVPGDSDGSGDGPSEHEHRPQNTPPPQQPKRIEANDEHTIRF